jgi:hypothetical protein
MHAPRPGGKEAHVARRGRTGSTTLEVRITFEPSWGSPAGVAPAYARVGPIPICIKASYLPLNHGFRPREHPPYNTHSLQVIGDSFGVFFFVYTTLSGELA